MEFRLLGPFELLAGGEVLSLGRARQRALLALLLVHAGESVSVDRVVDELWGERPPATAQHAVQVHVSGLRKLLRGAGSDVLLRGSAAGYLLDVDAEHVDARRFERLIEQAQRLAGDDDAGARELFERALSLWRGPPLPEFRDLGFAAREADRLEELRALALEGTVEAALACGEHAQAIGTLTSLIAANPLREQPRRLLMLALYRSGRHAEALAVYRDACAALDEIGLQPGPDLRALEEAILRHDSSLGAASVAAEASDSEAASPSTVKERRPADMTTAAGGRPATRRQSRKVVTALFCDVTGSTALGEELDPEALHGVMNRYFKELRAVIERHGGTVEKFIGDAVMAVFGIPQVSEDDALRAVRAAWEIRERIPAVAEEVGVVLTFRTAVNTGMVLSGDGENLAVGDAVNVAARLEQAAPPGEILLGQETLRLVRDAVRVEELEPLTLKGKAEPVRAFRLEAVDPVAPGFARRLDISLVGRERELELVRGAWERTVEQSGCHLITILGVAGVGKSRLVAELLSAVGDSATVLRGRCLHYGEGITFWPLVEALGSLGEPARRVLERLGSGGAATPQELFWDVRRLLESLAHERPVILYVDDLQWAEETLLELLDHTVELSRGMPILILGAARPELLDDRPTWGGGKLNATTLLLEPLSAGECELLLDQLGSDIDRDLKARVIAASEGNPLFLEEMAVLARERHSLTVPSTIQALLAARLDGLPPDQRDLLEYGAIEGEVFHRRSVQILGRDHPNGELDLRLAGLVRRELIRPHPSTLEGDEAFRFRHMLIRDAAYDRLPKATRADLHERFAGWLEQTLSELAELDELAGWHLEQAVRYREDLGRPVDPALVRRAAERLGMAGRRAGERADAPAARSLLERALALAPVEDAVQAGIAVELAEQLIEVHDLARADALLTTAERVPETAALAALTRLEWLWAVNPQAASDAVESRLPEMLEWLARAGDERGLARAHMQAFGHQWLRCQVTSAAKEVKLAAEHARKAGDEGLRLSVLSWRVPLLVYGPQDGRAIAEELDLLEREQSPYLAGGIAIARGEIERLDGHLDEALRLTQGAIDNFRAMGEQSRVTEAELFLADVHLREGHLTEAHTLLLQCDARIANTGERNLRSTIQATLAQVYERLGDGTAARAALELSDQLGTAEDLWNPPITHAVRARLALADGDRESAERWARSAVEHASRTEFIETQAQTTLELAQVLSALENQHEAASSARAAVELFERKGDRPGARQAQALLTELALPSA